MLAKLRRRFVLMTMILVGLVLLAIFSATIFSTYQTQHSQIRYALERAVTSDRNPLDLNLDSNLNDVVNPGTGTIPPTGSGTANQQPMQEDQQPNDNGIPLGESFVPVVIVEYDSNQNLQIVNGDIVSIDTELIQSAVQQLSSTNDDEGWLNDLGLFYKRVDTQSGTRFAFASATPLYNDLLRVSGVSALIFLAAFLALFGISLLLSRIASKPVAEAWEKQRRFIADASHELKTPITVILANNNIVLSHPDKSVDSQRQWLESSQIEASHMKNLIRNLLALALTDAYEDESRKIAPLVELDLSALVNKALLQFEAVLFEHNLELKSDINEIICIKGDSNQIERLVMILLDNACKYSDEGGKVHVSLKAATGRHFKAVLTITNSGSMIALADLPHIFERFYRGDASHSNAIEGYGLGLSMAKNIVDAHHGHISINSDPAAGTTVQVTL